MKKKNWILLKTAYGLSKLDIDSIIAMTKMHDQLGEVYYDLHMTSGTIFSVYHEEYAKLMERIEEQEEFKSPGYSGNYPPHLSSWINPKKKAGDEEE